LLGSSLRLLGQLEDLNAPATDLRREALQGTSRCRCGEVGHRAVAGDELGHDLLDPGAALERQLDLNGDLATS
jgi:hypothetical protein